MIFVTPASLLPQAARCKGPQDHLLYRLRPIAGGGMSQKFIQSLFNSMRFNSMQIESSFGYTNGGG